MEKILLGHRVICEDNTEEYFTIQYYLCRTAFSPNKFSAWSGKTIVTLFIRYNIPQTETITENFTFPINNLGVKRVQKYNTGAKTYIKRL